MNAGEVWGGPGSGSFPCSDPGHSHPYGHTAPRGPGPLLGRPLGEPSKVVRLPVPVAKLAKRLADKTLRAGDINAFLDIAPQRPAAVPLMVSPAACGPR